MKLANWPAIGWFGMRGWPWGLKGIPLAEVIATPLPLRTLKFEMNGYTKYESKAGQIPTIATPFDFTQPENHPSKQT